MGGHYDKDIFKQLQEVLERSDRIEKEMKGMKVKHKIELATLNDRIGFLEKENAGLRQQVQCLTDDNERMKRIINNDSSNSSLPPSTDQKGKAANTYNTRKKSNKKCGAQEGHKGTTLTKQEVKNKIEVIFTIKLYRMENKRGSISPDMYLAFRSCQLQQNSAFTEMREEK